MTNYNVTVLPDNIAISVAEGTIISDALSKVLINLTYPCGGIGTCGHCIVYLNGLPVKACHTKIMQDSTIVIPDAARLTGQQVLTDARLYDPDENNFPLVEKIYLNLTEPTLDDSRNDGCRVIVEIANKLSVPVTSVYLEPSSLCDLPHKLRENNYNICATVYFEKGNVHVLSFLDKPIYGLAIDIGTTTVAVALCDMKTGAVIDTVGLSNPQATYGSDVITRIIYTEENENGTKFLQKEILKTISEAITTLTSRASITKDCLPIVVIAANTVMSHFFYNLPTDYLRREPYVPVVNEYPILRGSDIDLPIMNCGRVIVLSSISSYVGGDITAGIISTGLCKKKGLNVLIDVGTNGEIVLAGEGFMMACSCSAGPAFEGSGISCGSRAIKGAIDSVVFENGKMIFEVIGGNEVEPKSVCGSGLISLIAALLKAGLIDRSGRFATDEKFYVLHPNIVINEADIQNLIRAKAALFAGVQVLLNHLEIGINELTHIYVAGGFGRNLNVSNATKIGMFPPLNEHSYSYVGNSSLAGAIMVLNDRNIDANEIASSVLNLELSIGNEFMEEFILASFLPHTNYQLFEDL